MEIRTQSESSAESRYQFALGLHQKGLLVEAERAYVALLEDYPQHALSLHMLGLIAIHTGYPELAMDFLRRATDANPDYPLPYSDLGTLLDRSGRHPEAVECFDRAIVLKPDYVEAYNNRAGALINMGRLEEALTSYDQAIAFRPDYPEAHLNRAAVLMNNGRLSEALQDYEKVLASNPANSSAHLNQGLILAAMGQHQEAVDSYAKATSTGSHDAVLYANLADSLIALGRYEEAVENYNRSLANQPKNPKAYVSRGYAKAALGRHEDAINDFDQAIALKLGLAEAYQSRGVSLIALGRYVDAIASFDKAIEFRPASPEAYLNHGVALYRLERYEDAIESFKKVISYQPASPQAWCNIGSSLEALGRKLEAIEAYDKAIAIDPAYAMAYSNRGNALSSLQRHDEALDSFQRAVEIDPRYAEAYSNRGLTLSEAGRPNEAILSCDTAIALNPNLPDAYCNRSLALIRLGRYAEGWKQFEWRGRNIANLTAGAFSAPEWLGVEDISGKTLLVHWEQGLGDTIQFCRYLAQVEARGAKAFLLPQRPLVGLMKFLTASVTVLDHGPALPPFDFQCRLMSLPHAFRTTVETVPNAVPYLRADTARVQKWRTRLGERGFKIAISWQGSTGAIDVGRSLPVALFRRLAQIPGVRLISIQKGAGTEQLQNLPPDMRVETLGDDFDVGPGAFLDTAAVMEVCDLVISSDTAVVHLAGALGRPIWVALKKVADWRWMLDRTDSPWYPTMRLFRQKAAGDWEGLFAEVEAELRSRLGLLEPPAGPRAKLVATPDLPVAWGEVIDKITILEIKAERLVKPDALANVRRELALLSAALTPELLASGALSALRARLRSVNEALWEIEDDIRDKERAQEFDQTFIALARSVYRRNDERAALKREINDLLGSEIIEEKSYKEY